MLTHVIYHIPGRKVGCTSNLENRIKWYPKETVVEVLEELYDATDQEAGDIEWSWAERLGYLKWAHYVNRVKAEHYQKGLHIAGTLGGHKVGKENVALRRGWFSRSFEENQENGRKVGTNRGTCIHCGLETNLGMLKRWHNENCRKKGYGMEIDRAKLVSAISRVLPAVSRKETFEQADRLAFRNGSLVAYNDEISICERLPECEGIEGAVDGRRLHELLTKLTADVVTISVTDDKLSLRAGRSRATLDLLPVKLPLGEIDESGEEHPLPEGFAAMLRLVAGCCARDMSRPSLTCVRIGSGSGDELTPGDEIEATDGFRLARASFPGAVLPALLLPVGEAEVVCDYDVATIAVAEGGEWARFATADGNTVIHARTFAGRWPDLSRAIEVEGDEVNLPASLAEAVERARIFARREVRADENVRIALRPRQIEVSAQCDGVGAFSEVVRWEGTAEAVFLVHPDFIAEALGRSTRCVVGEDKIAFLGENWRHVVALQVERK